MSIKILIAAAGTGGHVMPALSIAEAAQNAGHRVHWIGTKSGIEARLVQNMPLSFLPMRGLRGKGKLHALLGLFYLAISTLQSLYCLFRIKPQVVLVMGGYISVPVGLAAILFRIPLVIHEQNTVEGSANRLLARFAHTILLGLPGAFAGYGQSRYVGNPVRPAILALANKKASLRKKSIKLNCLVLGGSQGASILNEHVLSTFVAMPEQVRPNLWHQCGKRDAASLQKRYQDAGIAVRLDAFIEDMAEAYLWADCVIARSGAMSVSEFEVLGLPAFLVPYPYATDDHQLHNAKWYCHKVAQSQLLEERAWQDEALITWLKGIKRTLVPTDSKDASEVILSILLSICASCF